MAATRLNPKPPIGKWEVIGSQIGGTTGLTVPDFNVYQELYVVAWRETQSVVAFQGTLIAGGFLTSRKNSFFLSGYAAMSPYFHGCVVSLSATTLKIEELFQNGTNYTSSSKMNVYAR